MAAGGWSARCAQLRVFSWENAPFGITHCQLSQRPIRLMWGLSEERAAVLLQPRPAALSVLHSGIKRGRSTATPCRYNSLGDEKQPRRRQPYRTSRCADCSEVNRKVAQAQEPIGICEFLAGKSRISGSQWTLPAISFPAEPALARPATAPGPAGRAFLLKWRELCSLGNRRPDVSVLGSKSEVQTMRG
jgi:hypothetical protein